MRKGTLFAPVALVLALASGPVLADPCPPGYSSPDGNEPCDPCTVGFYASSYGSLFCSACPAGRYAPNEGSAVCLLCQQGTYTPYIGGVACSTCPQGTIAPNNGSTTCQPCGPGYTNNASHTDCIPIVVSTEPSTWGS